MNIKRLDNNIYLLTLAADLTDSEQNPILEEAISKYPYGQGSLILDFNAVQMMNGLGAYFLAKLNIKAKQRHQSLLAYGVNRHYRDVLKVTGLEQVIAIYDTRAEAFSAAGIADTAQTSEIKIDRLPSDLSFWAKPIAALDVPEFPPTAINRNVKGLRAVGPVNGFGQLWQKTHRLTIDKNGFTPEMVIRKLKENLPVFQPKYNHFYPSKAGIMPGEIVAIDSSTPGGPVSTGVMVLYADDVSFTFMTPQGHPESGWVTFSAFEIDEKITAQITGLARANDPIYELAFRSVGANMQVNIWKHVLTALAENLGVPANVTVTPICVDKKLQWSEARNIRFNAQIKTLFYMPFRKLGKSKKSR